jgi:hypothetical protein
MTESQSYPLKWPKGWKRTQYRKRSAYKVTVDRAYEDLVRSLTLLGALKGSIIVSTNVRPRNALGTPRNDGATVSDPGVAVFWQTRAHKEQVIACDRWDSVKDNIRACGKAVEAMREMERAGASQVLDQMFTAFGALPASPDAVAARPWWQVFNFSHALIGELSLPMIDARYRELSKSAHPDRGGPPEQMLELNAAYEQARRHYGA